MSTVNDDLQRHERAGAKPALLPAVVRHELPQRARRGPLARLLAHPIQEEDPMKELTLAQGTIRYRESGNGSPIVLVHGLLANGELWRDVAPLLAADHRVIVPDWPLGSQDLPLNPDADVSPPAMAQLIADFIEALDLRDVTLVGNDTGGALCQMAAVSHPERLGRLVLTPCDAYEHFPPPAFAPLVAIARVPGAVNLILQASRLRAVRRLPNTYGLLTMQPHDDLTAAFVTPARRNVEVRRQTARFLTGFDKRHTLAAAARFAEFEKPVLIAWARDDRFFTLADGERLARDFPNARLEVLDDCRTFMMLDRPKELAELIAAFAREPAPRDTAALTD
ncbi:MAG TPA: alpha/beta hydrolase [Solirubrobacteraceae bacterium]|jgi:pimeloyl-ACP methyl ester carboxylesterase|nr:alpha/beta hydrolase [Solirubrobacteraceae bacterium]